MGFLDKLLGRSKKAVDTAEDKLGLGETESAPAASTPPPPPAAPPAATPPPPAPGAAPETGAAPEAGPGETA